MRVRNTGRHKGRLAPASSLISLVRCSWAVEGVGAALRAVFGVRLFCPAGVNPLEELIGTQPWTYSHVHPRNSGAFAWGEVEEISMAQSSSEVFLLLFFPHESAARVCLVWTHRDPSSVWTDRS